MLQRMASQTVPRKAADRWISSRRPARMHAVFSAITPSSRPVTGYALNDSAIIPKNYGERFVKRTSLPWDSFGASFAALSRDFGQDMIVRQFLQWIRTASAAERADATSALGRAYLYSDLSPDDRLA